jgi:hypothetical protein
MVPKMMPELKANTHCILEVEIWIPEEAGCDDIHIKFHLE